MNNTATPRRRTDDSFPPRPTLVFGLVYPAGIQPDDIITPLEQNLKIVGYQQDHVRKINLIVEAARYVDYLSRSGEHDLGECVNHARLVLASEIGSEDYVQAGQDLGDRLREIDVYFLSKIAATTIALLEGGSPGMNGGTEGAFVLPERHVYLIRSLKAEEEVDFLRSLFGERFVAVAGCAAPKDRPGYLSKATIQRHEEQVRRAFQQADYFVDARNRDTSRRYTERLIRILFSDPARGPTREEHGMFIAFGAARRSCDLSRQVGAAIMDELGSILAVGTNEVPAPRGGLYWDPWPDEKADDRDVGKDEATSGAEKRKTLYEIISAIESHGTQQIKEAAGEILAFAEPGEMAAKLFEGTNLDRVTDFGRAVHAEMSALLDAARRGIPVAERTLLVTTFPCHNCARHIVASGIKRVVYIEPYPKSMASHLHRDAVWFSEEEDEKSMLVVHGDPPVRLKEKVRFERFLGVAPRFYPGAFSRVMRVEDQGKVIKWPPYGERVSEAVFASRLRVQPFYMGQLKGALPEKGQGATIQGGGSPDEAI